VATPRTSRSGGSEPAAPAEAPAEKSTIRAWFSSTFSAFTALGRSVTTTETNEATTNDSSTTSKQPERTEQKKSQQSKLEQQSKASQSKPEKDNTARVLNRAAPLQVQILEAAGDKFVPDDTEMTEDQKRTAIEAVGEKDVFASHTVREPDWQKELEDWQRDLYEQFLMWRIKQLMSM